MRVCYQAALFVGTRLFAIPSSWLLCRNFWVTWRNMPLSQWMLWKTRWSLIASAWSNKENTKAYWKILVNWPEIFSRVTKINKLHQTDFVDSHRRRQKTQIKRDSVRTICLSKCLHRTGKGRDVIELASNSNHAPPRQAFELFDSYKTMDLRYS